MTKAEAIKRMEKDLLLFGRVCLPNTFEKTSPFFHIEMAQAFIDPAVDKLNIIAPRGHAKSSLAALVWPLHHLLFGPPGPKFVLLVSKTRDHAIRLLQSIKNILDYSEPFGHFFGHWGSANALAWREDSIYLKDGSYFLAKGTGQQVVGLKQGDQRPTLIILDDPEDMNNTKTGESMEFNLRWLLQSLVPARDADHGRVCVIGTPQHERCMVETLQAAEGWKTLRYQALPDHIITDGKLVKDIYDGRVLATPEMSLWPEQWPADKLIREWMSLRSMNRESSFFREYLCKIIGDEDQLFKAKYFRYWEGDLQTPGPEAILHVRVRDSEACDDRVPVNLYMGVDPASSTAEQADFSTIVVIGVDEAMNRYVVEYFRGRVTPMVLAETIISFYKKYLPLRTTIESVGYQEMLRDYVRSKAVIPGLEVKEMPRNSKSARLESLEPLFANRQVLLKEGMNELVDELLLYPRARHDDLLDGFYYATKRNFPAHHGVPTVAPKLSPYQEWLESLGEMAPSWKIR